MAKGVIYREKDHLPNVSAELLEDLRITLPAVVEACRAKVPIRQHNEIKGYGVDKTQRSLQIDLMITKLKLLKTSPTGW